MVALSISEAAKIRQGGDLFVVATHFPPLYSNQRETAFSRLIEDARPTIAVYGHLHGPGIPAGFAGERSGVRYVLASCDAAAFRPVRLID